MISEQFHIINFGARCVHNICALLFIFIFNWLCSLIFNYKPSVVWTNSRAVTSEVTWYTEYGALGADSCVSVYTTVRPKCPSSSTFLHQYALRSGPSFSITGPPFSRCYHKFYIDFRFLLTFVKFSINLCNIKLKKSVLMG